MKLYADIRGAIRTLLATVVQATVTSTALGTSVNDYVRTDGGSFVDDGFTPGSELTASGFVNAGNNGTSTILAVAPSVMTVDQALTPEATGALATLAIGLPSMLALENMKLPDGQPTTGRPYARDYLLRAPQNSSRRISVGLAPARRRHTGLYQLSLYVGENTGARAAEDLADACRELLEQHEQVLSNGRAIYLHNPSLGAGRLDGTWWTVPLTVAYRVDTIN